MQDKIDFEKYISFGFEEMVKKYFALGWRPIPLRGKVPTIRRWTETKLTPDEFFELWDENFNIGIVTGPIKDGVSLVAIDVDQPNLLEFDPKVFGDKAMIHTTSGGPRVVVYVRGEVESVKVEAPYVRLTQDDREKLNEKAYDNKGRLKTKISLLEVLSNGRQFMAPPSIHPETKKPLEWLTPLFPPSDEKILEKEDFIKLLVSAVKNKAWSGYVHLCVDKNAFASIVKDDDSTDDDGEKVIKRIREIVNRIYETSFKDEFENVKVPDDFRRMGVEDVDNFRNEMIERLKEVVAGVVFNAIKKGFIGRERIDDAISVLISRMIPYVQRMVRGAMVHPYLAKIYRHFSEFFDFLVYEKEVRDVEGSFYIVETVVNVELEKLRDVMITEVPMIVLEMGGDDRGHIIYYYDEEEGYWKPWAENRILEIVVNLFGEKWKPTERNKLIEMVKSWGFVRNLKEPPINTINVDNGILKIDFKSGEVELLPHNRNYYFFHKIPWKYDPDAKCERILKFFREVVREEDVEVLIEIFGYCLLRDYPIQKAFIFLGEGANGKSTTLDLLRAFIGEDAVTEYSLHELETNRFAAGDLRFKLANICGELRSSVLTSSDLFKKAIGNKDRLKGEKKFKDAFMFKNYAKFIFAANRLPQVYDDTDAFFRRWVIINFPNKFEGDKADPDILEKLITPEEMSGLLNLAVQRLIRLKQRGAFSYSKSVDEIRQDYIRKSDPIGAFITDCVEPDPYCAIPKDEFYQAFKRYCDKVKLPVFNQDRFFKNVPRVVEVRTDQLNLEGKRPRVYVGIRLIPHEFLNGFYFYVQRDGKTVFENSESYEIETLNSKWCKVIIVSGGAEAISTPGTESLSLVETAGNNGDIGFDLQSVVDTKEKEPYYEPAGDEKRQLIEWLRMKRSFRTEEFASYYGLEYDQARRLLRYAWGKGFVYYRMMDGYWEVEVIPPEDPDLI